MQSKNFFRKNRNDFIKIKIIKNNIKPSVCKEQAALLYGVKVLESAFLDYDTIIAFGKAELYNKLNHP